ncbi:MAG: type II secretion system protein GspN [Bdellovibrionota bacterium]
MGAIGGLFSVLNQQKWKIVFTVFMTSVFYFMLFPFSDLTDFVSNTIAKQTQNQVQLTMDSMGLSILPPGLALENAQVEIGSFAPLKAQRLALTPSPTGLIHQKPYGTFEAKGLFRGNAKISVSAGKKSDGGVNREKIEMKAQKLSLSDLKDFLRLPVSIRGSADLLSSSQVDLSWNEQPESELQILIEKFELPPASVPTSFGPIALPEINLSQVDLKGRLAAGRFIIEKGQIGKDTDDFSGSIRGKMDMALRNAGDGTPVPVFGAYDLEFDLLVKPAFETKAALFLSFIAAHKTPSTQGSRYRFKVTGMQWGAPPDISTVR